MAPMTPADYATLLTAALTIGGFVWGFYTGFVPRWIKRTIGYHQLREDVADVKGDTEQLHDDYESLSDEIQTVKTGVVAISRAVEDEHDSVRSRELREELYDGSGDCPSDFLRDGGTESDDD